MEEASVLASPSGHRFMESGRVYVIMLTYPQGPPPEPRADEGAAA